MQRKKVSPSLTKGRGLNRRPLPLDPIHAQTGLAIQNDFAELDKHNSNFLILIPRGTPV